MKNNHEQDPMKSNIKAPSVVPVLINERIDETLKNLEYGKKNHKPLKRTFVLVAACICTISIGTVAVFGQELPIIRSLVEFVNPSAAKNYEAVKTEVKDIHKIRLESKNNGEKNNTENIPLNQTATDKGITITVNDMSYDGINLVVGFDVISEERFDGDAEQIDIDVLPYFHSGKSLVLYNNSSEVKNKKTMSTDEKLKKVKDSAIPISITCKSANSFLSRQDSKHYKGYASFNFGDADSEILDDYSLSLLCREVGKVDGQWKIDTGIKKKDIYTKADSIQSNVIHNFSNGTVNSVKIVRSALNNIVSLKGFYNKVSDDLKTSFPGFFILDENGKCLNYEYLDQRVSNDDGAFCTDISILKVPVNTKKLTVLPYQRVSSDGIQNSADLTKLPASIKFNDMVINISNVVRKNGKFEMSYTVDGLTDSKYSTYFDFIDKNGNKIDRANKISERIKPMDYESEKGTYVFKTDKPEDITRAVCYGFEYELLTDYKFEVKLK